MRTKSGITFTPNAIRTASQLLRSSLSMMENFTQFEDPQFEDCSYMDEAKRALAAIVHDQWANGGLLFQSFWSFLREKREEIAAAKTWKQVAEYVRLNSALYTVRDKQLYSYDAPVTADMDTTKRLLCDELNEDRELHDELMSNNKEAVA